MTSWRRLTTRPPALLTCGGRSRPERIAVSRGAGRLLAQPHAGSTRRWLGRWTSQGACFEASVMRQGMSMPKRASPLQGETNEVQRTRDPQRHLASFIAHRVRPTFHVAR